MSYSLRQHGIHEVEKQLRSSMRKSGLATIKVAVTRHAGKFKFDFTGAPAEVVKAKAILANWN
jgi:hypothetical protein